MMLALTVVMLITSGANVYASDQNAITILKMVKTTEAVEAKTEPEDTAEVFEIFPAESNLLVVEEIDADWYSIAYKGEILYVKKSSTVDSVLYGEEEQKPLEEEMSEVSQETTVLVEVLEREQTDTKRTIVWGIIIGVLVISIIIVGIIGKIKEDSENLVNKVEENKVEEDKVEEVAEEKVEETKGNEA